MRDMALPLSNVTEHQWTYQRPAWSRSCGAKIYALSCITSVRFMSPLEHPHASTSQSYSSAHFLNHHWSWIFAEKWNQQAQNQCYYDAEPPQRFERQRPPMDKRGQKSLKCQSCKNDPTTEQSNSSVRRMTWKTFSSTAWRCIVITQVKCSNDLLNLFSSKANKLWIYKKLNFSTVVNEVGVRRANVDRYHMKYSCENDPGTEQPRKSKDKEHNWMIQENKNYDLPTMVELAMPLFSITKNLGKRFFFSGSTCTASCAV